MKKSTVLILTLMSFFFGAFIGMLCSPFTKGIGNNSGNTENYYGDSWIEEMEKKKTEKV